MNDIMKDRLFESTLIYENTYRITNCFDSHERMNTFSYLIIGNERAMLIDTMFGYGNIREYCQKLTDKPVILVCTHYHGDHTGGNFDFDEYYMHADDIPFMKSAFDRAMNDTAAYRNMRLSQMKNAALDEFKEKVTANDFSMPHPICIWPIFDGDVFDLGKRLIEVVHVGGHTPGEIVLIDAENKAAFTGDACNSNTLLQLPGSLSVEEYKEFLVKLKGKQNLFDHCYGGHEDFDSSIVDEGIELVDRVLSGTDDKEKSESFGRTCFYAAYHKESGRGRKDGKRFNMAYLPDNIYKKEKPKRIL